MTRILRKPVMIDDELHLKLKLYAVKHSISMRDFVDQTLRNALPPDEEITNGETEKERKGLRLMKVKELFSSP